MAAKPKKKPSPRSRKIRLAGKTWLCSLKKNRVACKVAPKVARPKRLRCPKTSPAQGHVMPAGAKKWTKPQRKAYCETGTKPGVAGLGRARRRRSRK